MVGLNKPPDHYYIRLLAPDVGSHTAVFVERANFRHVGRLRRSFVQKLSEHRSAHACWSWCGLMFTATGTELLSSRLLILWFNVSDVTRGCCLSTRLGYSRLHHGCLLCFVRTVAGLLPWLLMSVEMFPCCLKQIIFMLLLFFKVLETLWESKTFSFLVEVQRLSFR